MFYLYIFNFSCCAIIRIKYLNPVKHLWMSIFAKITVFSKSYLIDVWLGSIYVSLWLFIYIMLDLDLYFFYEKIKIKTILLSAVFDYPDFMICEVYLL